MVDTTPGVDDEPDEGVGVVDVDDDVEVGDVEVDDVEVDVVVFIIAGGQHVTSRSATTPSVNEKKKKKKKNRRLFLNQK